MPKLGRPSANKGNQDEKRFEPYKTAANKVTAAKASAIEPVAADSATADSANEPEANEDATIVKTDATKAESTKSVSSHISGEVPEDLVDYDDFDLDLELDVSSPSKDTDPTDYSNDTSLLSDDGETKKVDSNDTTVTDAANNPDKTVIKIEDSDNVAENGEVNETSETASKAITAGDANTITKTPEEQAAEERAFAELQSQQAHDAWTWGIRNGLMLHPELRTCLGLLQVKDSTATSFEINGFKFNATLMLVGIAEDAPTTEQADAVEEPVVIKQETPEPTQEENTVHQHQIEQVQNLNQQVELSTTKAPKLIIDTAKSKPSLRDIAPLSAKPTSTQTSASASASVPASKRIPCKYGAACKRGDECIYDHTQPYIDPTAGTKKHCTFVNRPSGCNKGDECSFSHELENVACKASLRKQCTNYRCVYKHKDDGDGVMFASAAAKKEAELAEAERDAEDAKAKADAAKAMHEAALEQAEREADFAEQMLGGPPPKTPVVKAPATKIPIHKTTDTKTPATAPPAGPKNPGSLAKAANEKRGHENDVDDDGDSDDYTKSRPRKRHQTTQDANVRQQTYDRGRFGQQQNDYGNQQHGYQSYGNQFATQYANPFAHQYGGQQTGYQYNGYQQRDGARGRGRSHNGRGRGNARQSQYRNVTAQANTPQGELKIKGSAHHNP